MPAQRAIDCEKAARWTVPTETKGARRAAMERTEYILCVIVVVERSLELLADAVDQGRSNMSSVRDVGGIEDVIGVWLRCRGHSRRKGLDKLSKLKKPVP